MNLDELLKSIREEGKKESALSPNSSTVNTEDEKLEIAKRHLLQKQMDNCKLKKTEFSINDDALKMIIQSYTREAGVRNLERQLAKLTRKVVTLIEKNEAKSIFYTCIQISFDTDLLRFLI